MKEDKLLNKIYQRDRIKRFITLLIGLTISSISFNLLLKPNNLISGGVSGLSIILEDIINIEPSAFILIANILLLLLSLITLGKEKTFHSILGSLLYPGIIFLTSNITKYVHVEQNQILLSCLFAGVLSGIGAGLIFKSGYTTGGTDILNQIVSKYFKISMSKATYFTDGTIILFSGLVYSINTILYGILLIYIYSYMIDKVIIGISKSKAFYIITEYPEEIKTYIINKLNHSVTSIKASGGYFKEKNTVLMVVLPTKEYYKFKQEILSIDNKAFFVVTDAYEVVGGE